MKRSLLILWAIALLSGGSELLAQRAIWSTAYYAGWMQGYITPQNIRWSGVTHIAHFALVPNSDGTLNDAGNSVTASAASAITTAGHNAGKKVIITVGGWNSEYLFVSATSAANRAKFINNLVTLMRNRNYDGIDIDWEPLSASSDSLYTRFITQLRTSLDSINPKPLLTCAIAWTPSIPAKVASKFDQMNIMTYDLSGAWSGWVTWHNSPIYHGGQKFPGLSKYVPSCDGMVDDFVAAGIPLAKLGIGIDFYGYVWSGGSGLPHGGPTAPGESWSSPPSVQGNVPYYSLKDTYDESLYGRWDAGAKAAYFSVDVADAASDRFVSYDNLQTCVEKINYARTKGIGGVIIWELGGGYRASLGVGQRDSLMMAISQALILGVPGEGKGQIPAQFRLSQNYPNPFNPVSDIRYEVPQTSRVRLVVYDPLGREVTTLLDEVRSPGTYSARFNGDKYASGVYFYRLTAVSTSDPAKTFIASRKMMLMK